MDRDRVLNVRCTPDEIAMVKALAEHRGLSQSDIVRQLIREAHARDIGEGSPKKKRK